MDPITILNMISLALHCVICAMSIVVLLTQFARFYTTYGLFVMFSMLTGIFSGFRQNFLNAMLLDYFGPMKAPKALGISGTAITFMISINHPVLGALADATGNFTASLHYVGAFVLLGTLVLASRSIFFRWDEENKRKAEAKTKDVETNLTSDQSS